MLAREEQLQPILIAEPRHLHLKLQIKQAQPSARRKSHILKYHLDKPFLELNLKLQIKQAQLSARSRSHTLKHHLPKTSSLKIQNKTSPAIRQKQNPHPEAPPGLTLPKKFSVRISTCCFYTEVLSGQADFLASFTLFPQLCDPAACCREKSCRECAGITKRGFQGAFVAPQ